MRSPTRVLPMATHELRNPKLAGQIWEWVDSFDDTLTRGHALNWLANEVDGPIRSEVRRRRAQIVRELRSSGWSWGEISKEFGISRARAQQLAETT